MRRPRAQNAGPFGKYHPEVKPIRVGSVQPCVRAEGSQEAAMSSFIPAQVPTVTARRTVRVQAVAESRSLAPALVGTGLTVAAVVTSMLAFAAI